MALISPLESGTRDECLRPPAVAKVWVGTGAPHETVAVPGVALGTGDVLIAVELSTVCGSDVHTTLGHRDAPTPLVLGHESVGRVVAIGDEGAVDVDDVPLRLGDRVVWSLCASCGHCDRCRRGLPQKCRTLRKYGHERIEARWELSGGFATHVHVRTGTALVRVGERLASAAVAPASCATATAWAALARAEQVVPLDGAVVLVTGAGLVGLTAAAMAADRGATVIVSDPSKSRRKVAKRFGAAHTVDPLRIEGTRTLDAVRATLGREKDSVVDVVIEASGSSQAVATAFDVVAIGGIVVLVGSVSPSASVALNPERVVRGLITVTGVHNYTPDHLRGAVDYLRQHGQVRPFETLVGEIFPLDRLDEAINSAANGEALRIGIDPRR